jgi:ankyrin repeat protein
MELLISFGAKLHHTNNNGESALKYCARTGNAEVVKILIEAHAKLETDSDHLNFALELANKGGHEEVKQMLEQAISPSAADSLTS